MYLAILILCAVGLLAGAGGVLAMIYKRVTLALVFLLVSVLALYLTMLFINKL